MNPKIAEMITDKIISIMEKGECPWSKPWNATQRMPKNFVSKKPYRGANVWLLLSANYACQYWLTYKQAQSLGGNVKQGEKACPVIFWNWSEVTTDGITRKVPFLRYYSVFNLLQTEGIEIPKVETREHNPIETAEKLVAGMKNPPTIAHGYTQACYVPSLDAVQMPDASSFVSEESYYNTLFHELTHATGAQSRLNRDGITGSINFGSASYSKEELIAELGASYLCAESGILSRTIDASAAYLKGWISKLRDDKTLFISAASAAQRAFDYIVGTTFETAED